MSDNVRETGRLEAFSDAIFAFAMTLLVLELKDPALSGANLVQGLINQWPADFAFVTSFATVLIMWVNHHNMFNVIKRIDTKFMFLNGFLLFFVTLTPFTTFLVTDHILSSDSNVAAAVYSGAFLSLALVWNILWRHSSGKKRLLGSDVTDSRVRRITGSYYVGPVFYFVAFVTAFFSGLASVSIVLLVALYYLIVANYGSSNERDRENED